MEKKLYSFRNAMMIVAILLVFPIFASKAAAQEAGNTASTFKFNNVSPSIPAVQQPIRRQSAEQQVSRILLVLVC